MSDGGLGMFVVALIAVYLLPGADMILVLQTGADAGRRPALAVAIGLALARSVHVTVAALGGAALLASAPHLFEVVKGLGAAYLVWLGVAILRSGDHDAFGAHATHGLEDLAPGRAVLRGLFTNLLNPKALLFCTILLPRFVDPAAGDMDARFLLLGVILVAVGLAFDVVFATAGEGLGHLLARSPRLSRLRRWLFGGLLIAFGARLALSSLAA